MSLFNVHIPVTTAVVMTTDVHTSFVVSLVKSACTRVAKDAGPLFMSELDVSVCIASQLREVGVVVEREMPIVPVWKTEGGVDVTLHSRRVDIAAFHKRGKTGEICVLVEIKVGSRLEDRHRHQAAAYSKITGCPALLVLFTRSADAKGGNVIFEFIQKNLE